MFQHVEALQKAQAEIQRLHKERERYEDSMKKAFMRGVCALNIEALSMFHTADTGRQEQGGPAFVSKTCTLDTGPHKSNAFAIPDSLQLICWWCGERGGTGTVQYRTKLMKTNVLKILSYGLKILS